MPLIDLNGLGHFKDKENAMIAEKFSASKAYAAGDYCYYNGTLYKFKTAHAAGAWTTSDVETVKLAHDVTDLKESINDVRTVVDNRIVTPESTLFAGYLSAGGGFTESANFATTDYVPIDQGIEYSWEIINTSDTYSNMRYICLYDENKQWVRNVASPNNDIRYFVTRANEYYARFNVGTKISNIKSINIYPRNNESDVELNPTLDIPQIKNLDEKRDTLHARRPLIAFIFDGFYDLNDTMLGILKNHGFYGGFAPQYANLTITTGAAADNLSYTKKWEAQGHEILVHTSTELVDSVELATGNTIIENCFTTLKKYGFDAKGIIGSGGVIAEKFLPKIKKLFSWCSSTANHSAAQTSTIDFSADSPYKLWRYSMQLSTLAEQKSAVDTAINNNQLLLFYAHCNSADLGYFTQENFNELLTYIESKVSNNEIEVKKPTDAITDFYTIRYEDVI